MASGQYPSTSLADTLRHQRVGVALSTGFFGFYHHAGVLRALAESGIRPLKLSGASAGAMVAAMYASGLTPTQIGEALLGVTRPDFWDLHLPWGRTGFGLLAGHRFRGQLSRVLKVHRFEDCPVPVVVAATNVDSGRVTYFSSGPLISAVYASCAFPYLLAPITIDGQRYLDGGVGEKTPLVPFLKDTTIDVVLISYMPASLGRKKERAPGFRGFIPPLSSFFMDTPLQEREERDRVAVELLEKEGKRVIYLSPPRVSLGPFTLQRASRALEQGYRGALKLLRSP